MKDESNQDNADDLNSGRLNQLHLKMIQSKRNNHEPKEKAPNAKENENENQDHEFIKDDEKLYKD
ncbi:hypothetical protein DDB_G0271582 [Dictyostelium discoideum AX4]|uniref:Uncharacterized protein n=1 Tax=Dictyostelium discoideum TaxID=44689 RepID=Q55AU5_DICDI|nr:hypothetical protein DDB_G0271582 [Dictyostelium discoideum AX4]EAL71655.1 hypothetical protein DDB_G0271582 [Dictyostelium discoideum AX4]|eukprot:XP_645601.1 hypothetical protein DDB_G0271582 [Dictyostelium discoideum AX4]